MTYLPENARSELVTPRNFSDGGVVDTRRMFQAACPASQRPGDSPTRGSGFGAVAETIGVTGGGITAGGGVGGGGGLPRPPLPAGGVVSAGGCAVADDVGAGAGSCRAGAGAAAGVVGAAAAIFFSAQAMTSVTAAIDPRNSGLINRLRERDRRARASLRGARHPGE